MRTKAIPGLYILILIVSGVEGGPNANAELSLEWRLGPSLAAGQYRGCIFSCSFASWAPTGCDRCLGKSPFNDAEGDEKSHLMKTHPEACMPTYFLATRPGGHSAKLRERLMRWVLWPVRLHVLSFPSADLVWSLLA